MLTLTKVSLAQVDELFRYKQKRLNLPEFPGYSNDQWGIKAHNRPWIIEVGSFSEGQSVIEVGAGYSTLPSYIAKRYGVEIWIGDDFGIHSNEPIWSRWGDPNCLPSKYPDVKYVFQRFGDFSKEYPNKYFDRIYSVSTLEHININQRLTSIKDIHRCLKPGGWELHSIDIGYKNPLGILKSAITDRLIHYFPFLYTLFRDHLSEIQQWINIIKMSGVKIATDIPTPVDLLDRRVLVESPDVVYRYYPPNDSPKEYLPSASLLLIIKDI